MPSISEGSSIVAAEALSLGCSVVASPLESLQLLTCGSSHGTLSADFSVDAFAGALFADAIRWDRGEYAPEGSAAFWRERLDRKRIARELRLHFDQILSTPQ